MSEPEVVQQENVVLFGTNGTGKTTFMLEYAVNFLTAYPWKNVLIVLADNGERKYDPIPRIRPQELPYINGFFKIFATDFPYHVPGKTRFDPKKQKHVPLVFNTVYEMLYHYFVPRDDEGDQTRFDGLLINDDCGVLYSRRPEDVLDLYRKRRQANMYIISNFHGLTTDMPKAFFSYLTRIILCKTGDSHEDTMMKLPLPKRQEFEEKYLLVEELAKEDKFAKVEIKLR